MNPSSASAAGREAALLAKKQFKRLAHATARPRIARADAIAQVIWKRWGIGIYRWRLKHVRWFLEIGLEEFSPASQYQYWLCLRSLLRITGRDRWYASLQGSWCKPK